MFDVKLVSKLFHVSGRPARLSRLRGSRAPPSSPLPWQELGREFCRQTFGKSFHSADVTPSQRSARYRSIPTSIPRTAPSSHWTLFIGTPAAGFARKLQFLSPNYKNIKPSIINPLEFICI